MLKVLDFIVRFIFLPGILLFILSFIPEAIKDIKEWKMLFATNSKQKVRKRKTVQTTAATVCSNSFSQFSKHLNKIILSHD